VDNPLYSKTFESHKAPQRLNQEKPKQKNKNLKPILKTTKNSKVKRFRSPDINIQRLEENPSNFPNQNSQKEAYKRMRRRSGKVKAESQVKREESIETEMKKQEYLKLK